MEIEYKCGCRVHIEMKSMEDRRFYKVERINNDLYPCKEHNRKLVDTFNEYLKMLANLKATEFKEQ